MNLVTRYRNELNSVPMRNWTSDEQDFFFAVVTQARDKGTQLIKFTQEDLKILTGYTDRNKSRFLNTLMSLENKIFEMRYTESTSNSRKTMLLFQEFETKWSDDLSDIVLEVAVTKNFDYIINRLESQFTQFELKQFTNIRSTYAKEMFKKLKQWRTVGKVEFSINDFREMLQVPKSYRATDINQVVLKPIKEELSHYFKKLKVKAIKSNKRGNPIISYKFTFQPEKTGKWLEDKYFQSYENPKLIKEKVEELMNDKSRSKKAQDNYLEPRNWLDN